MGNLKIIHHFYHNGQPSIPDHAVMSLYDKIFEDGANRYLTHGIETREKFLDAMENGCRLHVVIEEGRPLAIVWLNRFEGKTARIHFCFFKEAWGARSVEVMRFIVTELLNIQFEGEYVYDSLLGVTPVSNKPAVTFLHRLPFVRVLGDIPGYFFDEETRQSEPGTMSYTDRSLL